MASQQSTSKTSLRTVINQVTKEKLAWLDNQRQTLKALFLPILEKYEKPENKASLQFLREIHTVLKKKCTEALNPASSETEDLTVFLNWMSMDDPDEVIYFGGSEHLVRHWIEVLVRKIKYQIEQNEYSCLYANVMTQYMDANSEDNEEGEEMGVEKGASGSGDELTDKEKTIQEFSDRIFKAPSDFKKDEFEHFLNNVLFDMKNPSQKEFVFRTRNRTVQFCETFHVNNSLTSSDVKFCIDGLLAEDLLGSEKAVTLKELQGNEDALNEVTTLLKNRLQNFTQWEWPEAVHVDFRRNMAGRYRAYMDEDIITALFLHYVGAKWSIQLKNLYKAIYTSPTVWKRGTGTVGDLYYKPNSIEGYRREFHSQSFLSILPSRMQDLATSSGYDDENSHKNSTNDSSPMRIKQKLLHLISNEIQLNSILRPETALTVVQTDMEWFGPSIVHEAVYSLMKFFGVSEEWITFFRKFLECPLKVGSPSAPVQVRKRGVPMSHLLSCLFGESLLFVMDLYVNQISGLSLFRIHDDFWFWGHNTDMVTKAWNGINNFTKLSGLKLNEEKSASVVCKYSTDSKSPVSTIRGPAPLPQRQVKWGFVVLHSDGIWRISPELLDPHVKEMREFLQKSESIMGWVHCHNRYIKFFIRNFAEPAVTFGKQHVVQIMKTLQAILKEVHKETNGYAVGALKRKFPDIWQDKEVMDSWVHWPVQQGGLSLYNPFLDLIPLHEVYRKSEEKQTDAGHSNKFGEVLDEDKTEWKRISEESRKRQKRRQSSEKIDEETVTDMEALDGSEDDSDDDNDSRKKKKNGKGFRKGAKRIGCATWCERYRETRWQRWRNTYCQILNKTDSGVNQNLDYDSWRENMYSSQLEDKLGDDSGFIDTNLIPLSLISSMQASRVHKN